MKKNVKNLLLVCFSAAFFSCNKNTSTDEGTTSGNGTTNPDPIEVTSCASSTGIARIICLADALKAHLSSTQVSVLQRTYAKGDAQKWSNFPVGIYNSRVGIRFGDMTSTQIQYAKAILKEVASGSSNEGWSELQQLINADEYLAANGGGSSYGASNFYLAFLGTPATTGTFEIQYGGHHVAFANTYKDGVLTGATPSFRGVEPFGAFTWNNGTNQPLNQEQAAFTSMLNGLSATQLATAKLNSTFSDVVAGPQKDANFPATSVGLQCSTLSATQKDLVLAAIRTYVYDTDDADTASIMTKYSGQLNNTFIAYSGTTSMTTRNDYVRIDGPAIWIEYSCQNGIVLSGTHPHSVWRDKVSDYGGN